MVKIEENKMNKEEICEDWCFKCKDGGSLRICDYGDCLKAYHPNCVGEEDSFLESEVPWTCRWHFCFKCNRCSSSNFRCFCCPKAICENCIIKFEFPIITEKQGLCEHCLTLAGIIEGVKNPDPDQGEIDFDDRNTFETLFKEYWEIVKEKEGLASSHVRHAFELLNMGRKVEDLPADSSGVEDSSQDEDEYKPTSSHDHSNDRKRIRKLNKCMRNGGNLSSTSRKVEFEEKARSLHEVITTQKSMVKMGEKKMNKEEICEDWCFKCKDGGSLRICDYGDCLKAYHPTCVGKDDSFLESEVPWKCRWHFCWKCNTRSKFRCCCCPKATCEHCIRKFGFPIIAEEQGLCEHCLTLAGIIEGVKNPDSDQEKIDFDDRNTCETLFKEYWEIVKEKEGLASSHVRRAFELLNMGSNVEDFPADSSGPEDRRAFELLNMGRNVEDLPTDSSGAEDSSQGEDEYQPTSSSDHSDERKRNRKLNKCKRNGGNPHLKSLVLGLACRLGVPTLHSKKRNGGNLSSRSRKRDSKKKVFNGWASNLLFDFLHSIGKDTTETLSEYDVSAIVIEYCHKNKLFDPEKKKKVVCDERLKSLLDKNYVWKNSIRNLLAPHFAENVEQSEDEHEQSEDKHEKFSEDESESAPISFKRQQNSSSNVKPQKNEAIDLVVRHRSCFASVVAENIRRLYLNRSLIEELLKKPENFEDKVIGSFVRIKSDPYDYLQKNSHMLVKVTGVKRTSRKDEATTDILLQVSCIPKDTSICLLSNDNFSEEECEDLWQRVKDGRLKRLSVVEFEEKARILHEVITKQWIVKEVYHLEKLIDKENEKGWRRELHAYIERKKLLETPSEQSRLLHEFPEVIAEETELDPTEMQYSTKDLLPESDSRKLSKPSTRHSGAHEQQCKGPESQGLEQQHHTVSSDESNDGDGGIHEAVVDEHAIIEVEENDPEASHLQLVSGNPIASIPKAQNSVLRERLKNKQNEPGSELIEICDYEQDRLNVNNEEKAGRPKTVKFYTRRNKG